MSPLKAFFGHNEVFVRVILYPFPFAIVRKALSRMIKLAGEANLINSFNPTVNDPTVTHDASAICKRHTFLHERGRPGHEYYSHPKML